MKTKTEGGRAVDEFRKICPPKDENNVDPEWLTMCGFFVKGWVAHATQQSPAKQTDGTCVHGYTERHCVHETCINHPSMS